MFYDPVLYTGRISCPWSMWPVVLAPFGWVHELTTAWEQIEQSGDSYVVIFHCRVFINFPTWFKIMGGVLMRVCRSTHVSFHLTLRCGSAHQCACVYMRVCVFVCRFPREDLALEPVQMVMWWLVRFSEEAPPGLDGLPQGTAKGRVPPG